MISRGIIYRYELKTPEGAQEAQELIKFINACGPGLASTVAVFCTLFGFVFPSSTAGGKCVFSMGGQLGSACPCRKKTVNFLFKNSAH